MDEAGPRFTTGVMARTSVSVYQNHPEGHRSLGSQCLIPEVWVWAENSPWELVPR
jgi:hypothetical protein